MNALCDEIFLKQPASGIEGSFQMPVMVGSHFSGHNSILKSGTLPDGDWKNGEKVK